MPREDAGEAKLIEYEEVCVAGEEGGSPDIFFESAKIVWEQRLDTAIEFLPIPTLDK